MSKFIDEARQLAAQCWCHETTSGREMDSTLAEVVAWKIAAWMDTAASMQAKLDEKDAEIAYLKSYIEGCNDSFATIMAEKEKYKAEIAALKSVSLEPVLVWHKVENEDECDVFDYKDIGHTNCQHCIPLYTAEQINKMATKEE